MHTHGPSCLQGPVTRARGWWKALLPPAGADSCQRLVQPPEEAPIRRALVERVRREIAAGTYDTPEKFEAALARLISDVRGD